MTDEADLRTTLERVEVARAMVRDDLVRTREAMAGWGTPDLVAAVDALLVALDEL